MSQCPLCGVHVESNAPAWSIVCKACVDSVLQGEAEIAAGHTVKWEDHLKAELREKISEEPPSPSPSSAPNSVI